MTTLRVRLDPSSLLAGLGTRASTKLEREA